MTNKELENLGFIRNSKINKNRYYNKYTDQHHYIDSKQASHHELLSIIHDDGITEGIEKGKKLRSEEFKKLINNTLFTI